MSKFLRQNMSHPKGSLTPLLNLAECCNHLGYQARHLLSQVFKHWLINLCIKQKQKRPLRNSYPSAITCRPWATNPRDYHMHIMVTWERPKTISDHKLHHWKQRCCVELKWKCCPWLGIFWICCLPLIHQSPTGRWLIVAGRLQCMCNFCLILICLYVP